MNMNLKAFTIIELMVAVAVIAILAGLATQSFFESRIRAKDANVKSSVRGYQQALETYNANYKTYFVYDRTAGSGCTPRLSLKDGEEYSAENGPYQIKGVGNGCVGVDGGGQGRMTRKDVSPYPSLSIADALLRSGYLSSVETFPGVKRFNSNDRDGADIPQDFILTICDSRGREPVLDGPATLSRASSYSIYAQLQRPTGDDQENADQLCGGRDTSYPRRILLDGFGGN